MYFNSTSFWIFFAVVYGLYLALPQRAQNRLLLVASYFFYGWWDVRFLSLLALSTVVDFLCARAIHASPDSRRRRRYVGVSLLVNLGILGCFKYSGFFYDSATTLLQRFGFEPDPWTLRIILPVGISFYTFQTLSYTIDVYRGRLEPCRNLADFALFVSFFPQLVAGPIERAGRLLPQIQASRSLRPQQLQEGLFLVGWGLFKKVVIADNLASTVDRVFAAGAASGGVDVLLALYAFAIQLYCDFSGYSDIARGLAKLMGFELMVNFRLPFLAADLPQFWARWHISLTTWIRDYLYRALVARRRGELRRNLSLILSFTLMGLWHGAAWTFVLWGLYFGVVQVAHRLLAPLRARLLPRANPLAEVVGILVTFHVVVLSALLFRAESLAHSADLAGQLLTAFRPSSQTFDCAAVLLFYSAPLALMQWAQQRSGDLLVFVRQGPTIRFAALAAVAAMTAIAYLLGADYHGGEAFVYFQF